jgi:hypothetical protein
MMFDRIKLGALLLIGIALPIAGCTSSEVDTLQVTPASVNIVVGATAQLTATGVYNHGTGPSTTQNLTNQVTWTTESADVATVSSTGVVTAMAPGTITITASIKGYTGLLSATSIITVPTTTTGGGSGDITSLTVTPGAQTVSAPGDQATYNVLGSVGGGVTVSLPGQVVCSSSSTDIATVTANGTSCVATAVAPGTATIQAQYTNADSTVATGTATITVTGVGSTNNDITNVTIIPGSQSVPSPGDTATYVAIGTTGTGTTVSMQGLVTWTSSTPQIATINAQTGVATAVGPGTSTITAQYTNADKTTATGVATLTVTGSGTTNSDVTGVNIIPSAQTVAAPGDTVAYSAVGTTASGATESLTGQVIWASSVTTIATIDASSGVATAVGQGTTTITATYTNADKTVATGTATMTVNTSGNTNSDITSITIIPGSQSVAAPGDTASFIAIGTTASGATVSVQGLATWASSSSTIATITPATGVATGVAAGTATITAQYVNADKTTATGTATFTVLAGGTEEYTSVSILPSAQTLTSGGTGQFIALATSGTTGLVTNVTDDPSLLQWSSSIPAVATISNSGLASGVSSGSSTITALLTNPGSGGVVSASADVTVSATPPPEPILSLTIIPSSITVLDFQLTGQFLAIGTFATSPYVRDLTNNPSTTWLSSEPEIFPVGTNSGGNSGASAGLVTAIGSGGATIIAESASQDGTIQTATSLFSCPYQLPAPPSPGSCFPGEVVGPTLLETLTVYNEGLNTTNWEVTASSATGTPDVIHCGPGWTLNGGTGGSVCTGTYPEGTTVTLTATQPTGATGTFGGWSYNCKPTAAITATGPNSCTVDLNSNDSVGAIFN